jgi:hypothetical protein
MDSKKRVAKQVKNLKKDFGEWNKIPQMIQLHWDEPHNELKLYGSGSPEFVSVKTDTKSLHTWHFTLYASETLNQNQHPLGELALSAKYAMNKALFEEALSRPDRGGSLLKDEAAFYLALQIICGWKRRTVAVGDALLEGLDTPLLDLRINDRHDAGTLYPHFWFLMHLFCLMRGIKPIDTSLYSYPESIAPYDQVLADWRTTDVTKVHQWVVEMAEHHVQKSDDSDHYAVNEFDSERAQLFPYEILAYLRIREWAGLPNPAKFDHPLMQQPLAYLPLDVPLPNPATPLLDQVIARYRQEFPDLRMPDGL